VISKHGYCKREEPLDVLPQCKGTKTSMVKGSKEIIVYLSCPSKRSKMHVFGLVVDLSSNEPGKYLYLKHRRKNWNRKKIGKGPENISSEKSVKK
jgi:hypothetical protein